MKVLLKLIAFLLIVILIFASFVYAYVYFTLKPIDHEYLELIKKYSDENGLQPTLVAGVIKTESNFNPGAVSKADAVGLMQLLPSTAEWITQHRGDEEEFNPEKLHDAEYNIGLGTFYLKYLFNMFGSMDYAILAYNGGLGNVQKWIDDKTITNDPNSYANIPFYETKTYIDRVKDNKEFYDKIWETVILREDDPQYLRAYNFLKSIILF